MMSRHVANVVMISTCCERWFNAQEEMLTLSGTQMHVGGPLCTNKLLWFAQAKLPAGFTATALLRQRPFNGAPMTVIQRQSLDGTTVVS